QERGLVALTAAANRLAHDHPQVQFVVRPHPFEGIQRYEQLLDRRANLHAIKRGTVDGWILRAAAVVQRSCTNGAEAAIAGVPTLSPRWVPVADEMAAAEVLSTPCDDHAALDREIRRALDGVAGGPAHQSVAAAIRDWFSEVDGLAHERIAGVVLERTRAR